MFDANVISQFERSLLSNERAAMRSALAPGGWPGGGHAGPAPVLDPYYHSPRLTWPPFSPSGTAILLNRVSAERQHRPVPTGPQDHFSPLQAVAALAERSAPSRAAGDGSRASPAPCWRRTAPRRSRRAACSSRRLRPPSFSFSTEARRWRSCRPCTMPRPAPTKPQDPPSPPDASLSLLSSTTRSWGSSAALMRYLGSPPPTSEGSRCTTV
jgi:hypothetical protein